MQWLHGDNCSFRRNYIVKLCGWYPHVATDHEEHSLYFKFHQAKAPGEYLKFDPQPVVLRRFDMPGGAERRSVSLRALLIHRLQSCHWVVGTHFPLRFYGLYPVFMLSSFRIAARHLLKGSQFSNIFWIRWFGAKPGKYLYILQEFLLFPIMILRFLLGRKPTWDNRITTVDGEVAETRP